MTTFSDSYKKITMYVIIMFFIVLTKNGFSQNQDYEFEKLTVKNGLSHNNVYAIYQDQLGFLWFGTQDGLNKYDGYNFTIYRHEPGNENSLLTGNFGKIYQDSSGIFWFGTFGGGIDKYNPRTNKFKNLSNDPNDPTSLSNNQITFFFMDSFNELWVGTSSGGLNKLNKDGETFTRYQHNPNDSTSLSHPRAKCICETSDGTLWIGTGNGLNQFNRETGKFRHYYHDPKNRNSLSANSIQHILADKNDMLWIATRNGGLNKFNPETEEFTHFMNDPDNPESINDNKVEFLYIDSYNQFWVGTYEGGLNLFDPEEETFKHFTHNPNYSESISNNRVEYIFEDRSKVLWIGTRGGGINKLDLKPKKFKNYKHDPFNKNSLPHTSIMALDHDQEGNLWIGTDGGGLTRYNPETGIFKHFKHSAHQLNTISGDRVWSVKVDRQGIIWAGTYLGGLNRIEFKNGKYTVTRYLNSRDPQSISSNQINSILEDNEGNIWLGTSDGLNKLIKEGNPENYHFKVYTQNKGDSLIFIDNYISSIYIDSKQRFWVGSYVGGLFRFFPDKEQFINYNPSQLDSSEFKSPIHVITIYEDKNNQLWIGTESNGLLHFDYEKMSFSPHPRNQALQSNMIMGMLEDDMGNFWISTSRTLAKYTPWNKNINNYTFTDGLESSGFNRNACLKASNGLMYFGSNAALSYFNPLKVGRNPFYPKVVITDFRVLNKSEWKNNLTPFAKTIHENNEIILNPKDYFFTIEFAALDYTTPTKNHYQYMLEGLDEDWIEASNTRSATYTNLDPGSYLFKVKGSNNDKIWNETPTEIKIKILPPFYKKTWFYILELVFILLIIVGYIRFRTRKLRIDKKILEKNVEERTREINLQKEELEAQADNLEKINQKLEQHQNHLEKLVNDRTKDLEIAKNRAEEADKLKSAFLANMSHEIRTPMNAIIGFTNLLSDQDMGTDQKTELIDLIIKNSHSLLNLIDDIIDIAKIESGQLRIIKKECDVNQLMNELFEDLQIRVEHNKNIKIIVDEKALQNPVKVYTDYYRIQQIFNNLTDNAIKFTEQGFVEFGYLTDSLKSENQLIFYVKDTGIGLTSEQQNTIFSRFTKVEHDKKKIYRGAGLGLAISKNLVEMLGGKIWVESALNKGSTFFFSIPFVQQESELVSNEPIQQNN
ncbi:MAG: two-component regulator propeller domain-containing protein [Bacteroidales bacterium]|jgi:ligand-binding sensor domain-containing protein/signal transduction histidine kinase|nr:two-component regulator propeller domain-containing protein [Bacteroidales bacterium]